MSSINMNEILGNSNAAKLMTYDEPQKIQSSFRRPSGPVNVDRIPVNVPAVSGSADHFIVVLTPVPAVDLQWKIAHVPEHLKPVDKMTIDQRFAPATASELLESEVFGNFHLKTSIIFSNPSVNFKIQVFRASTLCSKFSILSFNSEISLSFIWHTLSQPFQ
jgi:hypothetical protein